ncbi:hypothetical protein [Pararhizobium sp.]|uniref:hypothetical protein n=1 Tax=Pararhizobium sp. TaxID=1977563 RepID=UPI0027217C85|nr:hypothetical protein [Pararhizobium sp.]MDO9417326.1 hypothetical protein [Pararhizobium sp.]
MTIWRYTLCLTLVVLACLPAQPGEAAQGQDRLYAFLEPGQAGAPGDLPRGGKTGEDTPDKKAAPAKTETLSIDDTVVKLKELNVTYSITEGQLRDWLGNAEYTPYPAVAAALIGLLNGRPLQNVLDIDVIIYEYENAPGAKSPRRIKDVDQKTLLDAILKGYNDRYSLSTTDLSEITD